MVNPEGKAITVRPAVVLSDALPQPAQVFLSHSNADFAVAEWIAAQVRAVGLHPYLAERDAQPGQPLAEKVRCAIAGSDAVLAVLTDHGASSRYVQQEIGAALQCGRRVVALVVESVAQASLAMLDGVEHIRFDPSDLAAVSAELTLVLRKIGDQHDPAPPRALASTPRPALAVQFQAEINLTAGQVLVGVLVILAFAGFMYLVVTRAGHLSVSTGESAGPSAR